MASPEFACLSPVPAPDPGLLLVITVYGVVALSFMMAMYALEARGRRFVLAFAVGCVLSSVYGFASRSWPFGVIELIWSGVAIKRFAIS